MVTGKRPEQETDQSHWTKFLTSINNVEISREICRQGIPHGTTLQDLFLKVTEKEAGQQLAEGVALAHSAQVMEIQDMGYEVNELGQINVVCLNFFFFTFCGSSCSLGQFFIFMCNLYYT